MFVGFIVISLPIAAYRMWLICHSEYGINSGMDTLNDINKTLSGLCYAEVQSLSDKSGVPFHTLLKIRSGETKNPRYLTVKALADCLRRPKRKEKP